MITDLPKAERALVVALAYATLHHGPSPTRLDEVLRLADIDKHMIDAAAVEREAAVLTKRRR